MNKPKLKAKTGKKRAKTQLKTSFPIVAIGASAGGLEALEGFFTKMPSDAGVGFVVIQHLDPKHKSIMTSLLAKYTKMRIQEVEDGMVVEPDSIYLTPPNKNMVILNGLLYLMDLEKTHSVNLPINHFFRSLSHDLAEKAICIILSGTGTDGTLGLKTIKGAGGMVMVQEKKQAKYSGMPHSAIETGLIDFILPVEKMPAELLRYIKHPFIKAQENVDLSSLPKQNQTQKILSLIRSHTGHDFSNYKQNTIQRRIERRLIVHQINNFTDYVRYLQQTPTEMDILFKDMLITVTNFFRDPEAFLVIKENMITHIINNMTDNFTFRCWVPGCATGEEAYSLAMLLVEIQAETLQHFNVQIFATDINAEAIAIARMGIYPDSIAADISTERLKHFFIKKDKTYKITKQIREMVIFATQSLIKDPPFSKLHLVSCRNLLIYMDQVLQKKILPLFHYTLNQDGILMLGPSESIGEFSDLFIPLDKKWKIFQRQGENQGKEVDFHSNIKGEWKAHSARAEHKIDSLEPDIRDLAKKLILDEYSPSYVIINEKYEITFFSGDTEKYLTPPVGEASFNILVMARESIRFKISSALQKAIKQKLPITVNDLRIKYHNNYSLLDLIVRPIIRKGDLPALFLVIFKAKPLPEKPGAKTQKLPLKKAENQRLAELEQELQSTREYLQTAVEELETLNEEQRSINEEMQSTNEELQSTNEELETSKEELQSTNEELITVNSELQNKIDELSQANNDINNLLSSTEIGTIFLDNKLHIKRFTPAMTSIFNLIQTDLNRPISDITANIPYKEIFEDAKEVLATLIRKEVRIQNNQNSWFSVRIAPYRTTENMIDGVVITFVDVTKLKEAENSLRLAAVVNDSNDAITLIDLQGNILAWNKGATKLYGYTEKEALSMNISGIVPEHKKAEALELIEQIKTGQVVDSFITIRQAKDGSSKKIWLTITKIVDEKGVINSIASTERDISELNQAKEI